MLSSIPLLTLVTAIYAAPLRRTADPSCLEIDWVDCATNIPTSLQAKFNVMDSSSNGTLPPIPSTLKCGSMVVPLDYSKAVSDSNQIKLSLALYTPENPKGTIFFHTGGPGIPNVPFAWGLAFNDSDVAPEFSGLEDFEWMMLDTRGSGDSSPLKCSNDTFDAISLGLPTDQSQFDAIKSGSKAFAESCNSTETLKFIGTEQLVQDYESIRIALDHKQVSLMGISYGTYVFAEYADRFPFSIDKAALDAVTVHGLSDRDSIDFELRANERMLLRADAFCQSNSTCPPELQSLGKGGIPKLFSGLLANASSGSLVDAASNTTVTATDLRIALTVLLRSPPQYLEVIGGMALASQGNATALQTLKGVSAQFANALVPILPLVCPDDNIDDNTAQGWQNLVNSTSADDPAQIQNSLIILEKTHCAGWPFEGRPKTKIQNNFPYLWITADFDANTPTEWATFMHDNTPKSTLVVRHGDGHGTLQLPGPARDKIIEYLRNGSVTPSSNETLATVVPPGMKRGDLPDPYSIEFGPDVLPTK